ncbi:heterokaryon incompatibility protein-domain-containing protein [Apiospora arundinis]
MSSASTATRPDEAVTTIPYAYQDLQQSEIRLLTLYPGEEADQFVVRLTHVQLPQPESSTIEYEALSYTWGTSTSKSYVLTKTEDSSSGAPVQCKIYITENLADALRRIRDTTVAKTLWIDALCINQTNDAEKSIQVPLMTAIYKSAARVIVWLGPERDNSALTMRMLEFTSTRVHMDWANLTYTWFNADGMAEFRKEFGNEVSEFAVLIESLLERMWFTRVWVRQEVFLARKAVALCGTSEVGWDKFRNAAVVLAFKLCNPHVTSMAWNMMNINPLGLDEVRYALKGSQSTDPRDRIYGMLALIDSKGAGLPEVNYSLSTAEAYTAVAVHHFRTAKRLGLLMSCELAPNRMPGLPSWVPDWSSSPMTTGLGDIALFAMNTAACVNFPLGSKGGVMRIPGVVKKASRVKAVESMGSTYSQITEAILRLLRVAPAADMYYTGGHESFIDAICRTLLRGELQHVHTPRRSRYISLEVLRGASHHLRSLLSSTTSDNRSSEYAEHFKRLLSAGINSYEGCVLFLTEDGFVGLGPPLTSPGDTLFFPWGSFFPILMHPAPTTDVFDAKEGQQKQWLIVGPCFVSGLMSGEILYGPLPPNYSVVAEMRNDNGKPYIYKCVHRLVVDGDCVISTERDPKIEQERVRKVFGVDVDDLESVTPEMALNKGVPITWVDFV